MSADGDPLDDLVAAGLDPAEARAWAFLAKEGPAVASAVAKASGVTRTRAYALLEALEGRGLVEVRLREPLEFVALPLDAFLDRVLDRASREASEAEARRRGIAERLGLSPAPPDPRPGSFRLVEGRREAASATAKILGAAEREVLWLSSPAALARLATHAEGGEALDRLVASGAVRVRVLLAPRPGGDALLAEALALVPGLARVAPDAEGLAQRVLVDGVALLLLARDADGAGARRGEGVLLETSAPGLVADARRLFESLWSASTPVSSPIEREGS